MSSPNRPRLLAIDDIDRAAAAELAAYRAVVAHLPYEPKGHPLSEMFFFCLCARAARAARIVESGAPAAKARFSPPALRPPDPQPDTTALTPTVPVAAARLASRATWSSLGDAMRVRCAHRAVGREVVLIDGQGLRELRLACASCPSHAPMVFLPTSPRLAGTGAFSSAPALESTATTRASRGSRIRWMFQARETIPAGHQLEKGCAPLGYGYTLACLQRTAKTNYRRRGARRCSTVSCSAPPLGPTPIPPSREYGSMPAPHPRDQRFRLATRCSCARLRALATAWPQAEIGFWVTRSASRSCSTSFGFVDRRDHEAPARAGAMASRRRHDLALVLRLRPSPGRLCIARGR